jgi:hypothetical protein
MSSSRTMKGRIYVVETRNGRAWVPYKTLIGHAIGNRMVIGSVGDQFCLDQEYATRQTAIEAAKTKAREVFPMLLVEDIEWDVVEERVPAFHNG